MAITKEIRNILNIFTIIIVAIFILFFIRFVIGGPEDDWICVNGEWVRHGMPKAPMPTKPCDQNNNASFQLKGTLRL